MSECQPKATWEDHLSCHRAPMSKPVSKTKTLHRRPRYRWESDTSRSYSKILEASYRGSKFLWQNPVGSSMVQFHCNEWKLQKGTSWQVVPSILTKLKTHVNNGSFLLSRVIINVNVSCSVVALDCNSQVFLLSFPHVLMVHMNAHGIQLARLRSGKLTNVQFKNNWIQSFGNLVHEQIQMKHALLSERAKPPWPFSWASPIWQKAPFSEMH